MTVQIQSSSRYEERLKYLLDNLIEKLDEDFNTEGQEVLDQRIQSAARRVIDRFRQDVDCSESAKQDLIEMPVSKLRLQILNPMANFAAQHLTGILEEKQVNQTVDGIDAESLEIRKNMERELQSLEEERAALAQYIDRSRSVLEQEDGPSS